MTNPTRLALAHAAGKLHIKDGGDPFAVLSQKITGMADAMKKRGDDLETKFSEVTEQQLAIEQRLSRGAMMGGEPVPETWGAEFIAKHTGDLTTLGQSNRGAVGMQVKAIGSGATSAGPLGEPTRGMPSMMPVQRVTVRDLLNVVQVSSGAVEYAAQTARAMGAGMVAEGDLKPESNIAFELRNVTTKTVAHWVKASRQILDDAPQLRDVIDTDLRNGLAVQEEYQLLTGDGTDQNLTGLIPAATAFVDPLALTTPNQIDTIGAAILQTALADFPATGIVLHPADWARIRLLKDADGRYILGDPQATVAPNLFGLRIAMTKAQAAGTFLVGDFASAATLYDRWQPRVEVGYVDQDFTRNMVTLLAEMRLALAIRQPGALVTGAF
tara:strand:- start:152 stop:1303 length:1152 start_codon:yes stop_codon:yes gene_type:complete